MFCFLRSTSHESFVDDPHARLLSSCFHSRMLNLCTAIENDMACQSGGVGRSRPTILLAEEKKKVYRVDAYNRPVSATRMISKLHFGAKMKNCPLCSACLLPSILSRIFAKVDKHCTTRTIFERVKDYRRRRSIENHPASDWRAKNWLLSDLASGSKNS